MRQLRESIFDLSRDEIAVLQDALSEVDDIAIRGDLPDGRGTIDAWAFAKAAKSQPGLWRMLGVEDVEGTLDMLRRLGRSDAGAVFDIRAWPFDEEHHMDLVLTGPGVVMHAGGMEATAVVNSVDRRASERLQCRFNYKRYRRSDALPYYFDTLCYIAEALDELHQGTAEAIDDLSQDPPVTLADALGYYAEEAGNVEVLRVGKTMELGAQRLPSLFYLDRKTYSLLQLEQYSVKPAEKLADAYMTSHFASYRTAYALGYAAVAFANVMDAISASAEELPR